VFWPERTPPIRRWDTFRLAPNQRRSADLVAGLSEAARSGRRINSGDAMGPLGKCIDGPWGCRTYRLPPL